MSANRIWVFGAAVVILAIVVLGWMLGISPKLAEADAASGDREAVEQQNDQQEAVLVVLREQFENLDDLKRQLKELQGELPDAPKVESFIEYATGVADSSGVVISNIKADEPVAYGYDPAAPPPPAPAPSATPAPTDGATADGTGAAAVPTTPAPAVVQPAALYSIGISIEVQGSPEQVMAFSKQLQDGKRIFLPTAVAFSSGSAGVMGGTVTGYLFVLGSPATGAPDEPEK
jgi:Tfp pilus assembly protein PilO